MASGGLCRQTSLKKKIHHTICPCSSSIRAQGMSSASLCRRVDCDALAAAARAFRLRRYTSAPQFACLRGRPSVGRSYCRLDEAGCWRPGFWFPSLLLVAPFMRWAHRHWSVPLTVLRETRRLARRAAVRAPARRTVVMPAVRSGRGFRARPGGGRGRECPPFSLSLSPLFCPVGARASFFPPRGV